jgi:hypothetical protein
MSKARLPFLNYLAQHIFKDMFLGRATSRLRVPLCLSAQVGRTYFIRSTGQPTSIYIGYLEAVTHTVKLENNSAIAETELVFSHVRARNAVLTPLSLGDATTDVTIKQEQDNLNTLEQQLSD